jgi:hypothetical protein
LSGLTHSNHIPSLTPSLRTNPCERCQSNPDASPASSGRSHIVHYIRSVASTCYLTRGEKRLCISPVTIHSHPRDPPALPSCLSFPQAHPSSTRDMGLQGRTASGYTGEALPAQANWAGKTRCWLVCHALQPPGQPIVRSSSHASRMCLNRDALPFSCAAVLGCSWGERLEIRT